ncbi:S1 RNA-binding domain-containing protein, partial [Desulfovibrio sp.]|uniref:S1 RNA-binding domain-containing protein n=1 Tax=Desulfovibrio sp. TaxID=885 RepID=UPI0030785109
VESRRISLSLRDPEGDPWLQAADRLAAGTVVTGTVESRSQFGLFVSLAPGITGLLPAGVIKNAKNSGEFSKLDKGDSVTLVVQSVDTTARRISLAPEGMEEASAAEDKSWKQHTSSAPKDAGMSIMAQALQKALQNKR